MGYSSVVVIGLALAMDAFSVSICKGLAMEKVSWRNALIIGLWFGGFQALMPFLGYLLGGTFASRISTVDHWLGFILLNLIGFDMIREAAYKTNTEETGTVGFMEMLLLSIATSIDALAVGVTFATQGNAHIGFYVLIIGLETFFVSVAGVKIGNVFGSKYNRWAEMLGGSVLIILGLQILLKDLGYLSL